MQRIITPVVLLLLVACAGILHAMEPKAGHQVAQEFQNPTDADSKLGYWLYLPENYGQSNERFPLLLFLHGSGERGSDLSLVKKHGPPKLIAEGKPMPFVVVSPQCPDMKRWEPDQLLALLDDLSKKYTIDSSRVYVTGLSMGGSGTWRLITAAPDRFAAAIPICGRSGDVAKVADQAVELPIWIVVGDRDNKELVENCIEMDKVLKERKADVKLTLMHGVGHDSWTQTYATPEVYEWLLRHHKKPATEAK